jgi:hypothetical protein
MLTFRAVLCGCLMVVSLALVGCSGIQLPGEESSAQGWQGLTHAQKLAQADAACTARKTRPAIVGTAQRIASAPTAMFRTQEEVMFISFPCTLADQLRRGSKN